MEKQDREKISPGDTALASRFAENLTRLRKELGMTQADLAAHLNYSDKSVSKWERGEGLPDLQTAAALASLFDVPLDLLLQDPAKIPKQPESPDPGTGRRRIYVHLLASLLPFLAAAAAYFALQMASAPFGGELLFLYAFAAAGVVSTVFSCLWWGAAAKIFSVSLLCWSTAFSLFFTLHAFTGQAITIFAAAGVLQVLIILFFTMPARKKKKKNGLPFPPGRPQGKKKG